MRRIGWCQGVTVAHFASEKMGSTTLYCLENHITIPAEHKEIPKDHLLFLILQTVVNAKDTYSIGPKIIVVVIVTFLTIQYSLLLRPDT